MTADHTPERLSAEVAELAEVLGEIRVAGARQADWWTSDEDHALPIPFLKAECIPWAEGLLASDWYAAHLADVEARLAAVEALVRELHISGDLTPAGTDALLRALHPAPRRGGPR